MSTGSCCAATWPSWPPAATSKATIARTAASLRSYFQWCARRGLVGDRPVDPAVRARARLPPAPGPRPRRARTSCSSRDTDARDGPVAEVDRRDDAVLELLYGSGLRVAELCGLDVGDLDLARRVVTVTGKGVQAAPGAHPRPVRRAVRAWLDGPRAALTTERKPSPERCSTTAGGTGSGPGTSGGSSTAARRSPPTPTPSATASPPTSWTGAPTCGWCRNCWVTPACRPHRSTLM